MNQILYFKLKNFIKIKKIFKFLFYISIFLIFCSVYYFLHSFYTRSKESEISKKLLNSFNLNRLYSENKDYVTVELNRNSNFFVVGIIEIPTIDIEYPILSDTNDELLKIAPCRFYGPYPNEKGNMCIAAHNYDDNSFFSNLYKLEIGDCINIWNYENMISYKVYQKFEISKNDTSCTSQYTNGNKEITLITCNNLNGNRLVVKANEIKK